MLNRTQRNTIKKKTANASVLIVASVWFDVSKLLTS